LILGWRASPVSFLSGGAHPIPKQELKTGSVMSIRRKAWRNAMVATINEALDRRLFSLAPDGIEIEGAQIDFEIDGIPASAEVRTIGWDEIAARVTLWPAGPGCFMANGWLERRKGKWLQTSDGRPSMSGNHERVRRVAAIQIEPKGMPITGSSSYERARFIHGSEPMAPDAQR
jgi:hypothetical protein